MLITVCDVPEERRSDIERAGGEVVRTWNGLMDVQFKNHKIRNDGGAHFLVSSEEYSRIYIE